MQCMELEEGKWTEESYILGEGKGLEEGCNRLRRKIQGIVTIAGRGGLGRRPAAELVIKPWSNRGQSVRWAVFDCRGWNRAPIGAGPAQAVGHGHGEARGAGRQCQ